MVSITNVQLLLCWKWIALHSDNSASQTDLSMYWQELFVFRVKFIPGYYRKKYQRTKWTIVPTLPFIKIISLCLVLSSKWEDVIMDLWRHMPTFPQLCRNVTENRDWRPSPQSLCFTENSSWMKGEEHAFLFQRVFCPERRDRLRPPSRPSSSCFLVSFMLLDSSRGQSWTWWSLLWVSEVGVAFLGHVYWCCQTWPGGGKRQRLGRWKEDEAKGGENKSI